MTTDKKIPTQAAALANVILIGGGVACTFIFFYLLYYYGWTGQRRFSNPLGMVLYYVLAATLAALCFASSRLRPSRKINLALLLFSIAGCVYAVELIMTVWFSLPSVMKEEVVRERVKAAQKSGLDFDTRSALDVVDELRKKGIEAYGIGNRTDFFEKQADGSLKSKLTSAGEVLPLGGISNRVSIMCNESGNYIIYDSDEHGFNNPKGLWSNGRIDIIALGDSFTHGYCAPDDKNFVALIRKHYPATLNLGWHGHGPLLMLATMREYVQVVKPKVVLWFYFEGNDVADLTDERNSSLLMRYVGTGFSQRLFIRQADIDRVIADYFDRGLADYLGKSKALKRLEEIFETLADSRKLLKRTKKTVRLSQVRQRLGFVYGEAGDDQPRDDPSVESGTEMDLFGKILLQANESVSAWGGKLYFVYLPDWERYARPELAKRNRNRVLSLALTLGLDVIDLHEAFKAQKDPLALFPLRLRGHYNEAGHQVVAETVLRSIAVGK